MGQKLKLGLPPPNELMVVFGLHAGEKQMLDLAAMLALRGQLYILDCGNRSDMYQVARELRLHTLDPVMKLKNINLSRAFTCYQVNVLVKQVKPTPDVPVLIFDLLSTFLDESIRVHESVMLFTETIDCIQEINHVASVVVSAKPLSPISSPRLMLLAELKLRATHIWEEAAMQLPEDANLHPLLFGDSFFRDRR
jgi:hypothetical protein